MPEAVEVQIADAVVAELNAGARSWSGQFTAEHNWLPVYQPADLASLKVSVAPLTLDEDRVSRAAERCDYEVAVDFQKFVGATDGAADMTTLKALTKLVQDVHDFYRDAHALASLSTALVFEAKREDIYDLERLYRHQVFETVLLLKVRAYR